MLPFLQNFNGLLFGWTLWMYRQNLNNNNSFTCSWDNRGYLKTLGSSWILPRSPFLQILVGYTSDGPVNVPAKFEARSFTGTRSRDNSDWRFGRGLRTPNLGKEEAVVGRGWYRSKERWSVPIGPHSNFSSIFKHFRDIAAFVLQHGTCPHPTSSLPKKFPHARMGVGGWHLGYEERRCWANCPCN